MIKAISLVFLLGLAACSTAPPPSSAASACTADEASYACQVERYSKVGM